MSVRHAICASVVVFLASTTGFASQGAIAAESPEPCFGGIVAETDRDGQLIGTDCTDVIVSNESTTSIDAGAGDDVIIGAPNVVFANGGDGWDYIVGNSYGAILMGDSGDDILDAGTPPDTDALDEDVSRQINLAASVLSDVDAADFRHAAYDQLQAAHERAEHQAPADLDLRQKAIESNPQVQEVIGTPEAEGTQVDEELVDETAALNKEISAYERATSGYAGKLVTRAKATLGSTTSAEREWGNDPINGTEGDDILYGGRGTDRIYGKEGNDLLYGGIEDDEVRGNEGNDYLLGGFGSDDLYGGPGDDVVQGDATGDKMSDSSGSDVLSFASGGADGFPTINMTAYPNFPATSSPERGVYVDLGAGIANNGSAAGGGGGTDPASTVPGDGTVFSNFEHVIGTPFADYIVGSTGSNILEGGGGSDVIQGGGGSATDVLIGEAGGDNLTAPAGSWLVGGVGEDYCGGSTVVVDCDSKPSDWVGIRDTTKISVGMTTQSWAGNVKSQLYMAGSTTDWFTRNGEDDVVVQQIPDGSGPPSYYFTTTASTSKGQFSTLPEDSTPGCSYTATQVICSPSTNAVTLDLAGFGSNDNLSIYSVFKMTNPIILGGQGNDNLVGGTLTDDFLHDGSGNDIVSGEDGDDGMINSSGSDSLYGNYGDDLVENTSVCEGDSLYGGGDLDSTSWVQYKTNYVAGTTNGVFASISTNTIGRNQGGAATCSGEGTANTFTGYEDLEGSRHGDVLRGDGSSNQVIGRASDDQLRSYQSNDRILANSADDDSLDCGATGDSDIAVVDLSTNGTDTTNDCETVNTASPIFPDS